MKKIYVCSPLRGDLENNIKRAKAYSALVAQLGYLPITPHIYFTQFLDDARQEERELGMKLGLELLKICDELWYWGDPTEGMLAELRLAKELKIKVYARA